MDLHRFPPLTGPYGLATAPVLNVEVRQALAGLCHWARGQRSPESGLRASAAHEIAYVVRGALRVETATGTLEVRAGDFVTTSPAVPHSATALEDTDVFFVLLDPAAHF